MPEQPIPTDREYEGMAGALGDMMRRLDGVQVTDDEVEAALRTCTGHMHLSGVPDDCAVIALLFRKAGEQGVDLAHLRPKR